MPRTLWFLFSVTLWACAPVPSSDETFEDLDFDGFTADLDCDDSNASIYPGAPEDCSFPLVDYNCDGEVGGGDADKDGVVACNDCDDTNERIYPNAPETCDQIDNDCDSLVDDEDDTLLPDSGTPRFFDADKDGWGNPTLMIRSCQPLDGYVELGLDCDDRNDAIHPGATEVCDFIDNDCDELIDQEDEVTAGEDDPVCYMDDDADGFGDIDDVGVHTCACGEDETSVPGDCDDKARNIHPEAAFYGYPTADGHFDYNCDGTEEPHYDTQGVCELDAAGTACNFTRGWANGTPACGEVSGILTACKYNATKGTKPATGTGGGSTGSSSTSVPGCDFEYVLEQTTCR